MEFEEGFWKCIADCLNTTMTPPPNTNTPETDAYRTLSFHPQSEWAEFARSLERRLAEANKELTQHRRYQLQMAGACHAGSATEKQILCHNLELQRNLTEDLTTKLAEANREIEEYKKCAGYICTNHTDKDREQITCAVCMAKELTTLKQQMAAEQLAKDFVAGFMSAHTEDYVVNSIKQIQRDALLEAAETVGIGCGHELCSSAYCESRRDAREAILNRAKEI